MNFSIKSVCLALSLTAATMVTVQAKEVSLTDNVYFITEQLIVPTGSKQAWKWSGFESLPNNGMYQKRASNEYSTNKNKYTLSRGIVGEKSISLEGTKSSPKVIIFNSGYGEGDELWQLSQIVNPNNVTEMKSNCTLKNITTGGGENSGDTGETLEYQKFYKWQRKGSQPLYIAESKGKGYVLTSVFNDYNWKNYIVVRNPNIFNDYGVWNIIENGEEVTCSFS